MDIDLLSNEAMADHTIVTRALLALFRTTSRDTTPAGVDILPFLFWGLCKLPVRNAFYNNREVT